MGVDTTAGVFAVQCPNCGKFMLVEQKDAGKVVNCLLCKKPFQVAPAPPALPR
jgi:hypothetical protein